MSEDIDDEPRHIQIRSEMHTLVDRMSVLVSVATLTGFIGLIALVFTVVYVVRDKMGLSVILMVVAVVMVGLMKLALLIRSRYSTRWTILRGEYLAIRPFSSEG